MEAWKEFMSLLKMSAGFFLLICVLALSAKVQGQPNTEAFISIDCGIAEDHSYTDRVTTIPYTSDANFIESGTNHMISSDYITLNLSTQLSSLRSFPTGVRNCYALTSVTQGVKYLLRASFLYGNYDGQNSELRSKPIQFDLYYGVHFWTTITLSDPSFIYVAEVIVVAEANSISVCLVNTKSGTPFISSLELRPLRTSSYPAVNTSTSLILVDRLNVGSTQLVRYPDDLYDRIWNPFTSDRSWIAIATNSRVSSGPNDWFVVPSSVLQTAVTPAAAGASLDLYWNATVERDGLLSEYLFFSHFAEIQTNVSRKITIYINQGQLYGPFTPDYLVANHIHMLRPYSLRSYVYQIQRDGSSGEPPLLNAIEVFRSLRRYEVETDAGDVGAIMEIKSYYYLKRNWMGDPCAPRLLAWDGLICNYTTSAPPTIIVLNLSSSELTGEISPSVANLKNLKILDLSGNGLTGTIPDFLSKLASLQLLILSGNQFSGSIPPALLSKSENGILTLSLDGNPNLCKTGVYCKKKSTGSIAVILSIVLPVVAVLLVVALFFWRKKRRQQGLKRSNATVMLQSQKQMTHNEKVVIQAESRQFTYEELEKITKIFQHVIGKGGFGIVYHGCLENGIEVAVKLRSQSSSQGALELITEAQVLTRVHHRNLVRLIGYCMDGHHMALVYEYMARGSLEEHIKGLEGLKLRISFKR